MTYVDVPGSEAQRERLREVTLRMCDVGLLSTAAHYDLSDSPDRHRSAQDLATFFFRATQALQPDLFIEAGAKDARSSKRARRFLENARIVAFEANPYTYKRSNNRELSKAKVEYLHLALSDKPGPVTFHVREREDGTPRPDGHGSLMERERDYPYNFTPVTVDATTLDRHFSDYDFDTCALWVDVEGAAGHVLTGAREILKKAAILIVEVEDREIWKGAWTKPMVERFLYDAGMLPVARDFEYKHQYNIVFIRETLLDNPHLRLRIVQHLSALSAGSRTSAEPSIGPPD